MTEIELPNSKYSNDKILFSAVVKAFSPIIYYYIDNAILRGTSVHYTEASSPHQIIDAHFNEINQNLIFVFAEDVVKTIDLNVYEIRQSESVPSKFYFVSRANKETYFTIDFK